MHLGGGWIRGNMKEYFIFNPEKEKKESKWEKEGKNVGRGKLNFPSRKRNHKAYGAQSQRKRKYIFPRGE